jgi:Flp pilus assembly protein TadG
MRIKFGSQKGAAMVEFALILPLLIVLIFGIIEFSIIMYDKAMVTNASREGARAGIVLRLTPAGDLNPLTDAEIKSVVMGYLNTRLITFGSGTADATSTPPLPRKSGDQLTVTATYTYDFLLLPNFVTTLTGKIDLEAETVMRME